MTTCADVMTPNPKCHEHTASVTLVAKTMKEDNIGPVPIVDSRDGMHLLGIVTDRDIAIRVVACDRDARTTSAGDIMTKNPISLCPDVDIDEALKMMENCQVRRLPGVPRKARSKGR